MSAFCHIQLQQVKWAPDCSEKLQNIFEIGFKKCGVIVQKSLSEKKYSERKNSQTHFCCLYVELATVQILKANEEIPFEF